MAKKEKKKCNIVLNICIGLLLALFVCIIAFICIYSANLKVRSEEENKTEEIEDNAKSESTSYSLNFDTSNISNGGENSYTLADYSGTIDVSLDETGKVATLSYNRSTLSNTYLLNWDLTGVEEGVLESQTITFNGKVNDVLFSGIGQDATGDTILFLMEDGTIAYIPVYQSLTTNGVEGLKTYQTMSNITDIVKFYTANVTSGTSSSVTVLAQTKDGTLYDLAPIINDASNNQ